jgi:hypothetical protein
LVNGAVMVEYTLTHALVGEQQRLGLMSALLDPIERARFAQLGVCPDWRCLEPWLWQRVDRAGVARYSNPGICSAGLFSGI